SSTSDMARASARRSPASSRCARVDSVICAPVSVIWRPIIAGRPRTNTICGVEQVLAGTEQQAPHGASPPPARDAVRLPPAPPRGGPLALLRFMAANNMLRRQYAVLLLRLAYLKLRHRGRLKTDGLCFICPGVTLEIG